MGRGKELTSDEELNAGLEYLHRKGTIEQIARKLHVGDDKIKAAFAELGVPFPLPRRRDLPPEAKAQIVSNHLSGQPIEEQALLLGISRKLIERVLDEKNIKRRRGRKPRPVPPEFEKLKVNFIQGQLSLSQCVAILNKERYIMGEEAFRRRCHEGDLTLGGKKKNL